MTNITPHPDDLFSPLEFRSLIATIMTTYDDALDDLIDPDYDPSREGSTLDDYLSDRYIRGLNQIMRAFASVLPDSDTES